MTTIFENNIIARRYENRVCRVSYTLNNAQPVSGTIIGDQPLFYMDYEAETQDEEIFDAADFGILESEIESLKTEIQNLDKFSEGFMQDTGQVLQELFANKEAFTAKPSREDTAQILAEIQETLINSRMGAAYLDFAKEHNIEIIMNPQISEAHYDRRAGIISINPALERADQILLLSRELRRHWQHRQGALIHPLMFHPDNAVLINRIQSADLAVSMVRIAWELQLAGLKSVWERVENSSLSDLGRSLAREAFMDFRTLNNGQASAAVFESWFLSDRCRIEDKNLIQKMLADYMGYVFDVEEAEKNITPTLICALGEMPYGKNYLAIHAQTLMSDPIFTDVRDRSNANFLWFIKFERNFRDMEQELQTDCGQNAKGVRQQASPQDQEQGLLNEPQTAQIITLFPNGSSGTQADGQDGQTRIPLSSRDSKKQQGQQSAEIVYLRRWSGE